MQRPPPPVSGGTSLPAAIGNGTAHAFGNGIGRGIGDGEFGQQQEQHPEEREGSGEEDGEWHRSRAESLRVRFRSRLDATWRAAAPSSPSPTPSPSPCSSSPAPSPSPSPSPSPPPSAAGRRGSPMTDRTKKTGAGLGMARVARNDLKEKSNEATGGGADAGAAAASSRPQSPRVNDERGGKVMGHALERLKLSIALEASSALGTDEPRAVSPAPSPIHSPQPMERDTPPADTDAAEGVNDENEEEEAEEEKQMEDAMRAESEGADSDPENEDESDEERKESHENVCLRGWTGKYLVLNEDTAAVSLTGLIPLIWETWMLSVYRKKRGCKTRAFGSFRSPNGKYLSVEKKKRGLQGVDQSAPGEAEIFEVQLYEERTQKKTNKKTLYRTETQMLISTHFFCCGSGALQKIGMQRSPGVGAAEGLGECNGMYIEIGSEGEVFVGGRRKKAKCKLMVDAPAEERKAYFVSCLGECLAVDHDSQEVLADKTAPTPWKTWILCGGTAAGPRDPKEREAELERRPTVALTNRRLPSASRAEEDLDEEEVRVAFRSFVLGQFLSVVGADEAACGRKEKRRGKLVRDVDGFGEEEVCGLALRGHSVGDAECFVREPHGKGTFAFRHERTGFYLASLANGGLAAAGRRKGPSHQWRVIISYA